VGNPKTEKLWRLEVSNPLKDTGWRTLWKFGEDEKETYESLRDDLNRVNRPVLLRIVGMTGTHRAYKARS
jgi:hypothetical protein